MSICKQHTYIEDIRTGIGAANPVSATGTAKETILNITKKVFHAQFLSFFAHLMYDTTPLPLDKKFADSNHLRLAYKDLQYKKMVKTMSWLVMG